MSDDGTYGHSNAEKEKQIEAPQLPYLPKLPDSYRPKIALIGCGGISEYHLRNYKSLGLDVVAISSRDQKRGEERSKTFYPDASVFTDYKQMLKESDAEIVDITTDPSPRVSIMEDVIKSKRHVLSQKPFVQDITTGKKLIELAESHNVKLAVNQNARWAPHFSYIHEAIKAGIIGSIASIDFSLQWDHSWIENTAFNEIHHLILNDFAIHWFDILCTYMGTESAIQVSATARKAPKQSMKPPMCAHVIVEYENTQATMSFNGLVKHGQKDETTVCGTKATIRSSGISFLEQQVKLYNEEGYSSPELKGNWFKNGFQGTMCELLCSIEEKREPTHSARNNLKSLQLCIAAVQSADAGGKAIQL